MNDWTAIAGIVALSGFFGILLGLRIGLWFARCAFEKGRRLGSKPDYRHRMMDPCLNDCSSLQFACGHVLCPNRERSNG